MNSQRSTSVDNGYIVMMRMTRLAKDEWSWWNDEDDEWRKVTMKTKTLTNEDFTKKSSTAMNEILSWRIPRKGEKKTCFKRSNHRQENVTTKKDDYKYQGEFTSPWRQNSMYRMKKYSRKRDRMNVKTAGREKYRWNVNLEETSLIKHIIIVLTGQKQIWRKWLYSMRFETSMYENLVNDCVL